MLLFLREKVENAWALMVYINFPSAKYKSMTKGIGSTLVCHLWKLGIL